MKIYVAAKRCRFADVEYKIGDTIPTEVINPNRVNDLLAFKVIKAVDVPDPRMPKDETPDAKQGNEESGSAMHEADETTDSTDATGDQPADKPSQRKNSKATTAKKNQQGKAAK